MRYARIVLICVLLVLMMGCVGKFKGYRHTDQTPAALLAGDTEDKQYPELSQVGSPQAATYPKPQSSTLTPSAAAGMKQTPDLAPNVDPGIGHVAAEDPVTMISLEPGSAPPAPAMKTPADIMRAAIPLQPTQYRTILVVNHKNKFGDWVENHTCHILFRPAMFEERQIPELPPTAPVIKRESKQPIPTNPFSGYYRQPQTGQPTPGAAAGSTVPINLADYLRKMGVGGAPNVRTQPNPR